MVFKIQIKKDLLHPVQFAINYYKLNIRIIDIISIPEPKEQDTPDYEVLMDLLSGDPGEVFLLGYYSGKEKSSFTL